MDDRRKRQTSTATPAEPGELLLDVSYRELIASLDQIASLPLAAAYRTALTEQRDRIISQSFGDPDD